jgi:hypothetical protein
MIYDILEIKGDRRRYRELNAECFIADKTLSI